MLMKLKVIGKVNRMNTNKIMQMFVPAFDVILWRVPEVIVEFDEVSDEPERVNHEDQNRYQNVNCS